MQPLELVLFETDPARAKAAQAQGISSFMFDVEAHGKRSDSAPLTPISQRRHSMNFHASSKKARFTQSAGLILGIVEPLTTLKRQSPAGRES
jgi:hypothetical protein